ncbi:MAG: MFS transporter [Actinomycetota bacterium]
MSPGTRDPGPEAHASPREGIVGFWRALHYRWAFVSLATLLYWFAAHTLRPLVTLRLDDLGAGDAQIVVTVAAYPFFSLFFAIPGGRLVDRIGVDKVLTVSLLGMILVGIGYVVADSPLEILLVQVPNGVVEVGVWLALQALVSHAGSGAFLTRQLALFSLAWGLAQAVGPAVGGAVYESFGFEPLGLIYVGAALGSLVSCRLIRYRGSEREAEADAPDERNALERIRHIVDRPAVKGVLLSSFVGLYLQSLKQSFYPLVLERMGISVAQIGVLLSIMGATSLLIRLPLPSLLSRHGSGRVLVWGMWVSVVGIALTPWLGSVWLLGAAALVVGAGYGVNPPITVELMARHTQPEERGLAMGIRVSSNRLAQVVQPVVFGGLASITGMAMAFPASGLLLGAVTFMASREERQMAS